MNLFEKLLAEEFKPYYIISCAFNTDRLCDDNDNETRSLKKAKRFSTLEEAKKHIDFLISRPAVSYNVFDPKQREAGCPGGDFMYNYIYDGKETYWDKKHFNIYKITKNDWEKVWQDGANEILRKSPESSNIVRTILEKGKPGKTLYRIIDSNDRLFSYEKEHIVDLRITCTTSDPEKLLYVANATKRDAKAVVEFSSDTIAYEMKKTDSIWTNEAEHLIFGKFKVTKQEKPFSLKNVLDYYEDFIYFKAEPLDQSAEFAKNLIKKRIGHYKDDLEDKKYNDEYIEDRMYKRTLEENTLREASKKRFIDKIWNELEYDMNVPFSELKEFDPDIVKTISSVHDLPSSEEMTKWIDSGAADKILKELNLNWQNFTVGKLGPDNNTPLYIYLIDAYLIYKKAGGSRNDKKQAAKKDPYEIFNNSGLKVVNVGEDSSNSDMVLLKSLENEKFIFVTPLTHQAAKWMDSFQCGGQGAKWCIGYEQSKEYWENYTGYGDLFILAFSKNPNPEDNELKYMIQIDHDVRETQAWKQDDDPYDTIEAKKFKRFFGHNPNEFIKVMVEQVCCDDNVYNSNGDEVWFDANSDEPFTFDEEQFGFEASALVDDVLYFKDMIKGSGAVSRQDVYDAAYEKLTIDFSDSEFKGWYFGGLWAGDVLKISDLYDWLYECGVTNPGPSTLMHAEINTVIFDVTEDDPSFNDVYFEDCNIKNIIVDEKTNVRTIDCSMTFRSCNIGNITIPNQDYSRYVECPVSYSNFVKNTEILKPIDYIKELDETLINKKDIILLNDLENEDWAFIVPMTEIGAAFVSGRIFGLKPLNSYTYEDFLNGFVDVIAFNKKVGLRVTAYSNDYYLYKLKEDLRFDTALWYKNSEGFYVNNLFGVDTGEERNLYSNFGITMDQLTNSLKTNIADKYPDLALSDSINDIFKPEFQRLLKKYTNKFKDKPKMEESIFKEILREASKRRFIEPIYKDHINSSFSNDVNLSEELNNFIENQKEKGDFCENLIKWVDSGAADKYKIDWQKKNKNVLWYLLVSSYYKYLANGGSAKDRKNSLYNNPKSLFINKSGLKVTEGKDCKGYDMVILNELETDEFMFVAPLNWEACKYMDSFECGGAGARWCIGYEQSSSYWVDYLAKGNKFVLAFNKKEFKEKVDEDDTKYMLQIQQDVEYSLAWRQSDDPNDTIDEDEFFVSFGRNAEDILKVFNALNLDGTDYEAFQPLNLNKILNKEYPENYFEDKMIFTNSEDINFANCTIEKIDYPTLCDILCNYYGFHRIKDNLANIIFNNCAISEFMWEPEAKIDNAYCDVIFKDCDDIGTIRIADWSSQKSKERSENCCIKFENCVVSELHWECAEFDFYSMKNPIPHNGLDNTQIYSETFCEDEDFDEDDLE